MTLKEVLDTIISSTETDWWTEACWGATSGPSYRDQLDWATSGESNIVKVNSHSNVGTYKANVAITIAWGLEYLDNFQEDWANKFPDPSASGRFLDVFYNGALVFRGRYVSVDCGRAILPIPDQEWDDKQKKVVKLTVPERKRRLIQLLDSLRNHSEFDSYFRRAGFTVSDEEWPS
jgi:hypothetical protein